MKLSDWILKNNLTADTFAERIEVDPVTVRRYIAGTRQPRWKILQRIVQETRGEVTPDDFLSRVGGPNYMRQHVA